MKLYTRGGDDGTTGLRGARRVRKDDPIVAACGEVDELNATIGLAIADCDDKETTAALLDIQSDLFVVGASLAARGDDENTRIREADVSKLERWIDGAVAEVPPLACFVLPGGCNTAAALHAARAVCRRGERAIVSMAEGGAHGRWTLPYINRLGDLLFALARRANHRAGVGDTPWTGPPTD